MIATSIERFSKNGRNWRRPNSDSQEAIGHRCAVADQPQAFRIVGIDLQPEQIVGLAGARDLDVALGFEVEVGVEQDAHVVAGALAEGRQPVGDGGQHRAVGIELGIARAAREAGLVHVGRIDIEAEDVGLERLEAALLHMLAELHQVVERAHRLDAHHLGVAEAVGAAMRPVERQAVAHRPAEQGIDRNAQRLGLDVQQRVLDGGHRLLVQAARRLARDGLLPRHDALDRPRILADQALRHAADHGGEAGAAVALVVFRPADQAVVGRDLEEREVAPAGVAVQILDLGDFHGVSSPDARSID